ncbi:MAG: hypothetical protein K2L87_06925, partial [Clostridiales bacterium]|nr:hypothetical protein [Clostridiales bacterium]
YSGGQCTILGGVITGNKGPVAGVSTYSTGTLSLGGDVQIYDNTTANDVNSNITIGSATGVIKILSELTGGKKFGITREGNGLFTENFGKFHPDKEPTDYFVTESDTYRVVLSDLQGVREGAMLSNQNDINWLYTVQQSLGNNGDEKTFVLYTDWTAAPNNSYKTAFGTNGTAFYSGGLYVPAGASIVLDLNGHKIDRNYTSGIVMYVAGTLKIIDSTVDGKSENKPGSMTGGSHGVYVYSNGKCTMEEGIITGNSTYGVYDYSGSFTMTGGQIVKNNGPYNLYVASGGTLNLGGNPTIAEPAASGRNIYLTPSTVINIVAPIAGGTKFELTREGIGPLTSGWPTYNTDSLTGPIDPTNYFFSELPKDYEIEWDSEPTGTKEAVIISHNNMINWHYAVTTSLSTHTKQTVRLWPKSEEGKDDVYSWDAAQNDSYGTAFGTLSSFINGALYVPEGAEIELDLKGVDINRNLSSARGSGYVFYVAGTLTIVDTADNGEPGKITGGNNSSSGSAGAIHIAAGGTCTLNGAIIDGNTATSASSTAGAVYIAGPSGDKTATFNFLSGSI